MQNEYCPEQTCITLILGQRTPVADLYTCPCSDTSLLSACSAEQHCVECIFPQADLHHADFWGTAHLVQICTGILRVKQACCQPVLQSSTVQNAYSPKQVYITLILTQCTPVADLYTCPCSDTSLLSACSAKQHCAVGMHPALRRARHCCAKHAVNMLELSQLCNFGILPVSVEYNPPQGKMHADCLVLLCKTG